MKDKITAIVPVFNEEKAVRRVIEKLETVLVREGLPHEIIVVDDCSTDGTAEVLDGIKGIEVLSHPINRGYGNALKSGIIRASGDWILIIDSDGSYDPEDAARLVKNQKDYDMVIGSRTGGGSDSLVRRAAKCFLNRLAGYLAGTCIHDLNSGLRLFRKDACSKFWNLYPDRFSFTTTLTMCFSASGFNVGYVPINYLKRVGRSSIKPGHFLRFINLVVRLVIFFEPLKVFLPVSFILFLAGVFFAFYSFFHLHRIMDITVIVFLLSSLQLFFFGLVAELIVKRSNK